MPNLMSLTTDSFKNLTRSRLGRLGGDTFGALLDSVPKDQWLKIFGPIFTPDRLYALSEPAMEALLERLPQCSVIKDRMYDKLRVTTFGYNCMIEGSDPRCPYPFNFCVRIVGYQAAICLLIEPIGEDSRTVLGKIPPDQMPKRDLLLVVSDLINHSAQYASLRHYYVHLLKMFRPGTLSGNQWGTVGGTFSENEEADGAGQTAQRAFNETRSEFKNFQIRGWLPLTSGQVYQSGNVLEEQYIGAAIGFTTGPAVLATDEGIVESKALPIPDAISFLRKIDLLLNQGQVVDGYDAKVDHGLRCLITRLASAGIRL